MRQVIIENGYEIRDMLKTWGGKFDAASKVWTLTQAQFDRMTKFAAKGHSCGMGFVRGYAKINAYSQI